jgi:hypothetical protein
MTRPENQSDATADYNLDSWKRIAAYLGKTVRTVQRWEQEEGLPILRHQHKKRGTVYASTAEIDSWGLPILRHQHKKRGTVYASTAEIDSWLADRSTANSQESANHRRVLFGLGIAVVFIVILVGGWFTLNSNSHSPAKSALTFEERPWVLLVPLENLTGDPLLTDALDYSLYQGLVATHQVNITSPERVQDTLQLMRSDLDRRLDLELALEVCSRDTQIKTIVTGRLQRIGGEYTLGLEAIDAGTGLATEVVSGEATRPEDLLRLSRNLAGHLVDGVGRNSGTELELETVTTDSLRAAKLYTLANRMLVRQNLGGGDMNAAAEELLLEAVAEDPDFASAHLLLSWSIFRQRRQPTEFMPHADRAMELIESATEAERFFIRASRLSLAGDHNASIPIYQALAERYSDHFWGVSNLVSALFQTHRVAETPDALTQLANLRPTSLRLNYRAGYYLAAAGDSRAESLAKRAQQLATPVDWQGKLGYLVFWSESRMVRRAWADGDLLEFEAELGRLGNLTNRILLTQERQKAEADLALMNLALGRLETGWKQLEALNSDFYFRDEILATAAYFEEDHDALMRYLDAAVKTAKAQNYRYTIIPHLLARVGRVTEAEDLLGRLPLAPEIEMMLRGELAFSRGDYEEAIEKLESAIGALLAADGFYFLSSEMLAESFLKIEMPWRALWVLERASNQRARSAAGGIMSAWIRNQRLLAELLQETGEKTRAEEIKMELSMLLASGDENNSVKRWLNADP